MNTKHTPGPWTLCPATHSGLAISNAENGAFKAPRKALALCGKSRTTVEGWHYIAAINDHEQAEADARLLAAAPELHDLARAARDYLSGVPETAAGGDDEAVTLTRKLDALLARLDGAA